MLLSGRCYSLVPLESLMLGDLTQDYVEASDPIEYIFRTDVTVDKNCKKVEKKYKRAMGVYRGFINEGENLNNFCKQKPKVEYAERWNREQVKRSLAATLQFIGLDLTVRALAAYANSLEFSKAEYGNLVDNLTGNYCSQNISIISLRQLKKNMLLKFDRKEKFPFPKLQGNSLYPEGIRKGTFKDQAEEKEFIQTVQLFKSFCSWGNDVSNYRLLVPLLRHPIVMSFVIRQLANLRLDWEELDNKIVLLDTPSSIQVFCENLICRKVTTDTFRRKIHRGVGTNDLQDDFRRLYCQDFRDTDFRIRKQEPKILKIIDGLSFDEQNLMVSHFISLLTGQPDLFVRAGKFEEGKKFMRASMDQAWEQWAVGQSRNFDKSLYYEEALTVEKIDNKLYFEKARKNFSVVFDVNLGEFDRINQKVGKIKTAFNIQVPKKFLHWARRQWVSFEPNQVKERAWIINVFKRTIKESVFQAKSKFRIAPWTANLEALIVKELLLQLGMYKTSPFDITDEGLQVIPIELNYAPFALKYIHYQHNVLENVKADKTLADQDANIKRP